MRKSETAKHSRAVRQRRALMGQLDQGDIPRARREEHFDFIDFVSAHEDVAPFIGPQFVSSHVRDRFSFYVFRGGYVMFDPLGQGVLDVHIAVLPSYRRGQDLKLVCEAMIKSLSDHNHSSIILEREGEHVMCSKCEVPMVTKLVGRFDPANRGARGLARSLGFDEIESSTDRQVWEKEIPCLRE